MPIIALCALRHRFIFFELWDRSTMRQKSTISEQVWFDFRVCFPNVTCSLKICNMVTDLFRNGLLVPPPSQTPSLVIVGRKSQ